MAEYGICTLPYIPQRADATDKSEMVSMVLLGEPFEILRNDQDWYYVRNAMDDYQGWIFTRDVERMREDEVKGILDGNFALSADAYDLMTMQGETMTVGMGAIMPGHHNFYFRVGSKVVHHTGRSHNNFRKDVTVVTTVADRLLGCPYLWGGRTSFGLDCSGFIQLIFRFAGVLLPRDTGQQAEKGTRVLYSDAKPGDLAFFNNKDGRINHVGLLLEENGIMHASESVRVDRLDEQGIYNEQIKKHTHELSHIIRVL